MKTISLTVPMDYNALTRASDMLHGMAIDLSKEAPANTGIGERSEAWEQEHFGREQNNEGDTIGGDCAESLNTPTEPAAKSAGIDFTTLPSPAEPAAAEVFAAPKPAAPATSVTAATERATTIVEPTPPSAPIVTETAAPAGVDLDGEGLPWDHRIHASSKAKLSKKPNGWKKKRGVDAEVIAQVEAELREVMAAGPANPVAAAPAPAAASIFATPTPEPATPAPAAATAPVTTFPALMAAMTGAGYTAASPEVTAALNAQGLQALPLLAARPDLIPAVALALGV